MYIHSHLTLRAGALDDLRDWDFSFSGIFEYLWDLLVYHVAQHGFVGLVVVVVIVLSILIAFPPTRYLGSQLSTNLIQAIFSVVQLLTLGLGLLILTSGSRMGLGALRNFGRSLVDWAKSRK